MFEDICKIFILGQVNEMVYDIPIYLNLKKTFMGPILIISNVLEKSNWMPCKNCSSSFISCIE
jgi:hypothetical protein